MQTIVDGYSGANLYEIKSTSATHHYYTENSFPNSSYAKTYYTVTYYDNYNYNNTGSDDVAFISDGLTEAGSGTRKGLVTGTKSRVLDDATTATFVETAMFYDKYGRVVQTQQTQPIDASNAHKARVSNEINLLGEVLQTKTTNMVGSTVINTVLDKYTLDHRGRLLEVSKTVNNEAPIIVVKNSYIQLGQLLSENLGVTGDNSLQKVDYLYNIRGWLRGINNTPETSDLFAMQLFYNDYLSNLDLSIGNYNGNISSMKWTNDTLNGIWKAYGFKYDKLNRLNNAIYGEYTAATSSINSGFRGSEYKNRYDEYGLTYDLNGNVKTLNRRGIDNPSVSATVFSQIDQLGYTYTGNKLIKLDDARPDIVGRGDFYEKVTNTTEYSYDANGNMYKDDNKGIYNIAYNHMNLPKKVNFTATNDYIRYIYDAGGAKLRKIVVKGGVTQYTENYVGVCVYKTTGSNAFSASSDLQYILAEKGRLVRNSSSFNYEYHLKDHLGNIRVVFALNIGDSAMNNTQIEVLQYADYYPFGMLHNRAASLDHDNRRLYNGKELQSETFNLDAASGDETLFDWYDYGARFYDPQIGRWHSVDPMAETSRRWSPYNYCVSNPLRVIDPDGREIKYIIRDNNGKITQQLTYRNGNFWHSDGSRYNPGKESLSPNLYKTLAAYRKIESSGDKVLMNQLKTLETSDKTHFVESSTVKGSGVKPFEAGKLVSEEKEMVESGTPIGTHTNLNFSEEENKSFEDIEGVESTDFNTVVHEMQHQYDYDQGKNTDNLDDNTAEDPSEIRAVNNENRARKIEGTHKRTTYAGRKIDPDKLY